MTQEKKRSWCALHVLVTKCCVTSVACASSLILIPSICCSHFSCSSAMWDSSSESATYVCTRRFNWAGSQWKGKKTRALNDINFTTIHDHALMKKDRGEETDFSEKNHSLPCCALSASRPVLWAAQHRPTSLGTLSPIVTNTTFKAIRLLHDLHV